METHWEYSRPVEQIIERYKNTHKRWIRCRINPDHPYLVYDTPGKRYRMPSGLLNAYDDLYFSIEKDYYNEDKYVLLLSINRLPPYVLDIEEVRKLKWAYEEN